MKRKISVLLAFALLLALCACGGPKTVHSDAEAFTIAKEVVRKELKSPSSAKFCKVADAVIRCSENICIVSGWVEAQNGFGAMTRTNFQVTYYPVIDGRTVGYRDAHCIFS